MVPHSREIRKRGLYDLLAHSMRLERAVSCVGIRTGVGLKIAIRPSNVRMYAVTVDNYDCKECKRNKSVQESLMKCYAAIRCSETILARSTGRGGPV